MAKKVKEVETTVKATHSRGGWYRGEDEQKCDKKHNVFLTDAESEDLEMLARFFPEMKSDRNMRSKSNVMRLAFQAFREKYAPELAALKKSLPV